jgi:hypothetical protein
MESGLYLHPIGIMARPGQRIYLLRIGLNKTENMSNWLEKLKERWQVRSGWQVIVILVVFACTGFTVMFIKPVITDFLFASGKSTWFSFLYWILILPVYNLFLLFYGFIFGQFRFFWEFEKRFFGRIFKRSEKRSEREIVR